MKLVRQCDACGKEYMRSYYSDKLVVNGSEYFICPSCVNKALKALHKTDMRGEEQ